MLRSINAFVLALFSVGACLHPTRAQTLEAVPKPLVSQPKLAMQAAEQARTHWKAGRLSQALATVEAALRVEPKDLSLRFMRGSLLYETDRLDESTQQFNELAEQFPELAEIHNNLASLYARAGQLDLARLSLERALQAQPAYALAWENLAAVLARQSVQALQRAEEIAKTSERKRIEIKIKAARDLSDRLVKP
jgi:Flp pilus assembly protein TadD